MTSKTFAPANFDRSILESSKTRKDISSLELHQSD